MAAQNAVKVRNCEGLRMPARHEHCHALVGRRPQASKEGTRGTMRRRRCRAIYGDLGAADGVPDGNRCDQARASGPLVGVVGALLSPPEAVDGDDRCTIRSLNGKFGRAPSWPVEVQRA